MTPIQQILLGAGGVAKKTYMDDVFSTYVYKGDDTQGSTINNGIDLSGEGGMTWIKSRTQTNHHLLYDTLRGAGKPLYPSADSAEGDNNTQGVVQFNSNGFNLGSNDNANDGDHNYSSWSFRKAKGFFDIVTYTGNGSNRTIAHSLGSVPGLIIVKRLNSSRNWTVYHTSVGNQKYLTLNSTDDETTSSSRWNNTTPTSSVFSVGESSSVNANNDEYVAYLFAGGESTAATARSVDFDGTGDYLTVASSSDFSYGTGDFTWEFWGKVNDKASNRFIDHGTTDNDGSIHCNSDGRLTYVNSTTGSGGALYLNGPVLEIGRWYHIAACRSSGTTKLFVDGVEVASQADGHDYGSSARILTIGDISSNQYNTSLDGAISNFRIVKGTALYTSSFKPPTEPLTNITNTKILCCNDSSTTGSTVTPGTITANGDPTASTDSPFDDPAGFKFGDNKEGIIKCGSYVGNGSSTGPEIFLGNGWEPQWVMIKNATRAGYGWFFVDSMRGIVSDGADKPLYANTTAAEYTESDGTYIDLTPTGFKITSTATTLNYDGDTYIYCAIRRPDGYCGKPVETATDVFAMDTGNASTTIPAFDSGFPVDMTLTRKPASTFDTSLITRLTAKRYVSTSTNYAETGDQATATFDSNTGWRYGDIYNSDYQAWMWKRHAGFDVLAFEGNGVNRRPMMHGLNATPQMMWVKRRDSTSDWMVYHFGANGGSNPKNKELKLNTTAAEQTSYIWGEGPTSTYFELSDSATVNGDGNDYLALLFSSVDGISKVGYFDGSSSAQTITTGFQPRFVILKCTSHADDWFFFDTTRGWASGQDNTMILKLNTDDDQFTHTAGGPTSTGFTLTVDTGYNSNGRKFIYYAHA